MVLYLIDPTRIYAEKFGAGKSAHAQKGYQLTSTSGWNRQSSLWAQILLLHSITHLEGQQSSLRLRSSKLQKENFVIPTTKIANAAHDSCCDSNPSVNQAFEQMYFSGKESVCIKASYLTPQFVFYFK